MKTSGRIVFQGNDDCAAFKALSHLPASTEKISLYHKADDDNLSLKQHRADEELFPWKNVLLQVTEHCPNLRVLQLNSSGQQTELSIADLAEVLQRLSCLEYLSLGSTGFRTVSLLQDFDKLRRACEGLRKLKVLRFQKTHFVCDQTKRTEQGTVARLKCTRLVRALAASPALEKLQIQATSRYFSITMYSCDAEADEYRELHHHHHHLCDPQRRHTSYF
jgi:hypothetical protein